MSDDEADAKRGRGGGVVQNKAHDEEFELSRPKGTAAFRVLAISYRDLSAEDGSAPEVDSP